MKIKIAIFIFSLFYVSVKCIAQDNLMSRQTGSVKQIKLTDHAIHMFTKEDIEVQLSVYAPDIIRVRIAPSHLALSPTYAVVRKGEQNFKKITDGKNDLTLLTDSLKVVVQKNPLRIDFYNASGQWLDGDAPALGVLWQGKK